MKLLKSQRNELFELIEEKGLSPGMFDLEEDSKSTEEIRIYNIKLKNGEFYFSLRTSSIDKWGIKFCPGYQQYLDYRSDLSWYQVKKQAAE